jgi:cation transport regulator ChaC
MLAVLSLSLMAELVETLPHLRALAWGLVRLLLPTQLTMTTGVALTLRLLTAAQVHLTLWEREAVLVCHQLPAQVQVALGTLTSPALLEAQAPRPQRPQQQLPAQLLAL